MLSRAVDVGLKCRSCRKNINTSNFLIRIYSVHFAVCSWNKDHHNQFQIMTMLSSKQRSCWSANKDHAEQQTKIITINFKLWPCWAARSSQSTSKYERKITMMTIESMVTIKIMMIIMSCWTRESYSNNLWLTCNSVVAPMIGGLKLSLPPS